MNPVGTIKWVGGIPEVNLSAGSTSEKYFLVNKEFVDKFEELKEEILRLRGR